tara:strand:- start:1628 stop:1873 length:246 start_codon:yes stop_codon:yes gene_type:complete
MGVVKMVEIKKLSHVECEYIINVSKVLLKNYLGDLEYQQSEGGIDQLNFCSSSTPFFNEDIDAESYIVHLRKVVVQLEGLT